ncbi:MAG: bifunctional helix-turn-helix transcriptional regulator/GNAT family N-acetyltransferase [Pseudomonadota bacterium]
MQTNTIRHATRELVRALRIIDGTSCTPEVTLSEGHLLLAIAENPETTATELAETLELEKSTISRTIGRLEERGFLAREPSEADARVRSLSLTPAGRDVLAAIDRFADTEVAAALEFLAPDEVDALGTLFQRYSSALRRARATANLTIRPIEQADNAAVGHVIRTVMTEFGAVGEGFSIEDPEVDAMFESYAEPRSAFWVIERDGKVLGCGGVAPLAGADPSICELRKMYFLPALRGFGLGMPLMRRCLEAAREFGFETCYLETLASMHQARALYLRAGFRPTDGPLGATGHHGCDSFMTLDLTAEPAFAAITRSQRVKPATATEVCSET